MKKTTLAALLVMAMLLAACGSNDETRTADAAADDSTEAPEAETDTSVAEDDALSTDATGDGAVGDPEPTPEGSTETDDAAAAADTAGGQAGQTPAGFGLNGFRYCEILMTVPGADGAPVTEVWGTPGVGPCEEADWNAIDPQELMADLNATWILMNGPRYFTVDGTVDTAPAATDTAAESGGDIREFGSVPMRLLATVEASEDDVPYSPEVVVRTTTWTFNRGTEVYELTDPDGNTYIMQSYALIQDPDLTADDLASLGDRLDLPEGWAYSSRLLDEALQVALTPDGAIVVQDDLDNSYQRN